MRESKFFNNIIDHIKDQFKYRTHIETFNLTSFRFEDVFLNDPLSKAKINHTHHAFFPPTSSLINLRDLKL